MTIPKTREAAEKHAARLNWRIPLDSWASKQAEPYRLVEQPLARIINFRDFLAGTEHGHAEGKIEGRAEMLREVLEKLRSKEVTVFNFNHGGVTRDYQGKLADWLEKEMEFK